MQQNTQEQVLRVSDELIDVDSDLIYRYNGNPFTGICYELDPNGGWLRSEISYVNGMQDGVAKDWYENGQMDSETFYRKGVPHGRNREWDEQGRLRKESFYESGYRVEVKEWDESGRLVNHHITNENDPEYSWLQRARGIPQHAS